MSHVSNGEEKTVAYASQTLYATEKNYSMIETKASAIITGITKFQQYLYARCFTLKMDHKSLMLLALKHEIPMLAASRLQR